MKTKSLFTLMLASLVLLASCKKKQADIPTLPPVPKKVFIAGYEESNSGYALGRYWLDTVSTSISYPDGYVYLRNIEVVGNDRYLFGEVNPPGSPLKHTVWKNGSIIHEIPANATFKPEQMTVAGTDLYLVGYTSHSTAPYQRAAIWKNGVVTNLTQTGDYANLLEVFVNGSNVYVAGYDYNTGELVVAVWVNGTKQVVSDAKYVTDITASGSDVYITGTDQNNQPAYWRNGTKIVLPVLTNSTGDAFAIKIAGTDVYVAGTESPASANDMAVVWKNGVRSALPALYSTAGANAYDIDVDGENVYVCGFSELTNSYSYNAVVWKNGVIKNLTIGSQFSEAYSIKVQ